MTDSSRISSSNHLTSFDEHASDLVSQTPRQDDSYLKLMDVHDQDKFDYESKMWGLNDVGLSPKHLNSMRLKHCLADLNDTSGQVLEIGYGGGGMVRAIQSLRPDLRVSGCDISFTSASVAKSRSSDITFSTADALRLPYRTGSIDAVVMLDVIEHVGNPGDMIEEISRVLKPHGVYHLFAPCEWNIYTLHGLLGRVGWGAKRIYAGHVQMFTTQQLRDILRNRGFFERDVRWSGHIVNQLADVCYFSFLAIRGKNSSMSIESYVAHAQNRASARLLGFAKELIALMSFAESRILWRIPAWGIHLKLVQEPQQYGEVSK